METGAIPSREALAKTVREVVDRTPVLDMHTHLFSPGFGPLLLWGVDELLTYHYLVAEVFRYAPMPYEQWWALPRRAQADYVWQHVFLEHSPLSEAARGVLTALGLLGLDTASRNLGAYREFFASRSAREQVDAVFARAGVRSVVMTNDPFDPAERARWEERKGVDDARFETALRIDPLLARYADASAEMRKQGYKARRSCDRGSRGEVRRFLEDWIGRLRPRYVAASLTPDFTAGGNAAGAKVLRECVLPVAREHNLPLALMIGVKRRVNPGLRLAGDGAGQGDVNLVEGLCAAYPENKFLVTMLLRENQHELCVAARKFPNLLVFGCWWFLNVPETVAEVTNLRTELLGLSYVPQHSDARVLEHLLYKWAHSREVIGACLAERYDDLWRTGWRATRAEVERDVADLFSGNFRRFLSR
ncbi:MAG: glucuronate isomerase [Planctomycetota bacterium]